ncbi:autotransporter assembly complex protein TamA [Pseudohoeflea sp. DP4N28-3]|uniref:Autotransporter assembly complex protein TamA n=2 Tax=Pseudohoeflea coraliihabitans TaxID=2860393 RepID=A0ABS6WV20_9HYPH|nr:autotransporter assembly complex protein TamA [Pseudohoeflea sp. DP4N28-3]
MPAQAIEIFGFKLFESESEDKDDVFVADPLNYSVTLDIVGAFPTASGADDDLRDDLRAASELIREEGSPVSGSVGLISTASSDFEHLLGALYEDARYGGVVNVTLAGRPLESLRLDADLSVYEPVPVVFTVEPGPQFTFGTVALRGEAESLREPSNYGLEPGAIARSTTILAAETRIVEALQQKGRPLAEVSGRQVVADHATNTLDVTINVDAGPVAPFGTTSVDGAEKVDPDFVAYMAGIEPGTVYDPDALEAAEKRLKSLEVFSSVAVRGAETLHADGSVPVEVGVAERKFRYFGLGATFSSTEGGGLEAYWGHRNLLGRAEKLRIEGSVAGIGDTTRYQDLTYRGALLFEKPGVIAPASTFTSEFAVEQEDSDAYRRFSVIGKAGLVYQRTERQTLSGGVEVEYARLTDSFSVEQETLTVALPLEFVYDARNDTLDPTRGYRLLAHLEPAYETLGGNSFVKIRGEGSVYRALDEAKRFVVAGRLAAGTILGADLDDIPANRRYYAGGGGSVRGYAYQGIGPRDAAGDPTGGRSYLEASAELRIGVTEKIALVPFIDAGAVGAGSWLEDAELRTGAGVGVRYKTPFGPLRLDVAIPLDRRAGDPDYGIYAGIGQAF